VTTSGGRNPRVPRGAWIVGAWVGGIAAVLVVLVLVVGIVGGMLPTGTRTSVLEVAPSHQQGDVRPLWYPPDQAAALTAELAAAVDGSDWCVGWSIVMDGDVPYQDIAVPPYDINGAEPGNGGSGLRSGSYGQYADVGSNRGPGLSARTCPRWAEVEVVFHYEAATSPFEDNAVLRVEASETVVSDALRTHPALQVSPDALLHEDRGDNTDDVIGNAIAALPLALAEQGRIDPLSVEPVAAGTEGAVTFEDSEGEGGIDVLVANRTALLVGALVVLAGLVLLCMAAGQVPARWFPQEAGPGPWTSPHAGNPRRALKEQMERAEARSSAAGQGGSL
jgi:hypothetical protein